MEDDKRLVLLVDAFCNNDLVFNVAVSCKSLKADYLTKKVCGREDSNFHG